MAGVSSYPGVGGLSNLSKFLVRTTAIGLTIGLAAGAVLFSLPDRDTAAVTDSIDPAVILARIGSAAKTDSIESAVTMAGIDPAAMTDAIEPAGDDGPNRSGDGDRCYRAGGADG